VPDKFDGNGTDRPPAHLLGDLLAWLLQKASDHLGITPRGDELCGRCGHMRLDHWGLNEACMHESNECHCNPFVPSGTYKE
jgi:hypothetical protein